MAEEEDGKVAEEEDGKMAEGEDGKMAEGEDGKVAEEGGGKMAEEEDGKVAAVDRPFEGINGIWPVEVSVAAVAVGTGVVGPVAIG